MTYVKKPDGIYFHPTYGRIMRHEGSATSIHWSADMLSYLKRNFATTLNSDLAECLGVSQRTMLRKARELGLDKDPEWLRSVWDERRRMAHSASRLKGYPGGFLKGRHSNPDGEFKKGHKMTPGQEEKRRASFKAWYRTHPEEAKAKAFKAWETRRNNQNKTTV